MEVCFQVCKQDYKVPLKRQSNSRRNNDHTTIVEAACLTQRELEEKRKHDQLHK
jgi:hypothetical protein